MILLRPRRILAATSAAALALLSACSAPRVGGTVLERPAAAPARDATARTPVPRGVGAGSTIPGADADPSLNGASL